MPLTFVGKSFAHKGFRFYYDGIPPNCPTTCKLFATCQQNLLSNTVYEVDEVMAKTFICAKDLHEEDMVLVKVIEPQLLIAMENKDIFLGSTMTFTPINCDHNECEYIEMCSPQSILIQTGTKVKVLEKTEKITGCSKNRMLSIVKIEKKREETKP